MTRETPGRITFQLPYLNQFIQSPLLLLSSQSGEGRRRTDSLLPAADALLMAAEREEALLAAATAELCEREASDGEAADESAVRVPEVALLIVELEVVG